MNQLTIEKDNVIAAHNAADESTKVVLKVLFPAAFPAQDDRPIWERITSLAALYKHNGVTEPSFADVEESEREYMLNLWRWRNIVKCYNNRELPDWFNGQYKYCGWAEFRKELSPSGVGLSDSCCADSGSASSVGSRLTFLESDAVLAAQKNFPGVWEAIMLP